MNDTTTTSIRIPLDQYIKLKTEKINLSQLVSKFLDDYFIETPEEFEITELELEIKNMDAQIETIKQNKLKVLSQLAKLKQELEEEEKERDIKNTAHVQSLKANNPLRYFQ